LFSQIETGRGKEFAALLATNEVRVHCKCLGGLAKKFEKKFQNHVPWCKDTHSFFTDNDDIDHTLRHY